MTAIEKLKDAQEANKSMICLGLDLDPKKMPGDYARSTKGMYDFARGIIEATSDKVCAYKPNIAFYENLGPEGLSLLAQVISCIPKNIPIILDCKRGDIGNTAAQYAEAMYDRLGADFVTLSPYMGYDSLRPFLEHRMKGVFILCLTSNSGSKDFQLLEIDGKPLYRIVAEKVAYWNKDNSCGLVVGATQPEQLKEIRQVAGQMPLLIPGVGAQGGSLEKAAAYGTDNFSKLATINVSRSVLYASNQADFADKARIELVKLVVAVDKVRAGEVDLSDEPKDQAAPEQPAPTPEPPRQQETDRIEVTPVSETIAEPSPAPEPPAPESESTPPQQVETPAQAEPEPTTPEPPQPVEDTQPIERPAEPVPEEAVPEIVRRAREIAEQQRRNN